MSPRGEDLLFLIWFTNTSEEIGYTQTHDQERAHENPRIESVMKGVNKAVGPHNSTCVWVQPSGVSVSEVLWFYRQLARWLVVLKPVTKLSVMWQLYFVFPSIWKVC